MENNDYNLNDEPNLPLDNNGKNPFGLPNDYFLKFEEQFKKKIELENELQEFPILSSIEKTKSFIVPVNYFKSAENGLEYKSELESYHKLQSFKMPVFNDLEEDYKKQLQFAINHKIEIVEELKSYKILSSFDKISPFTVSENYFESITEKIKEKVYQNKQSKVSVLENILNFIFGKTMAFSFGLFLIIGLAFYFQKSSENIIESGDCKTLACLERNEILNNNKVVTNFDEDQLIDLVDVNTLNQQLNTKKEKPNSDSKLNMDSISEDDLLDEL